MHIGCRSKCPELKYNSPLLSFERRIAQVFLHYPSTEGTRSSSCLDTQSHTCGLHLFQVCVRWVFLLEAPSARCPSLAELLRPPVDWDCMFPQTAVSSGWWEPGKPIPVLPAGQRDTPTGRPPSATARAPSAAASTGPHGEHTALIHSLQDMWTESQNPHTQIDILHKNEFLKKFNIS